MKHPSRRRGPTWWLRRLVPVVAFASLIGPVPSAVASLSATTAVSPPPCGGVARHAEVLANSPKTTDGWRAGETWLAGPQGQDSMRPLAALAENPAVVGLVPDFAAHSVTVVYDAQAATAPAVTAAVQGFRGTFTASLRPSCHRRPALDATKASILRADWGQSAKSTVLFAYMDGETDSVKVVTSTSKPGAAELRQRFGDNVTVVDGNPRELQGPARSGDVSPHWGGSAAIDNHGLCTTGFSAQNQFGFKGGSTAAHCSSAIAGEAFWTAYSTNPAFFYGRGAGNPGYPFTDFQWVFDPGQSYTNVIHTDPCCPNERTVTSAGDAPLFSYLCADGVITGASCGGQVLNTDAVWCGSGFCRGNTTYASVTPWQPFAQPGDSGGPVYAQVGGCCAAARGLLIGGIYGNDAFFEKPSWMAANGLYIMTSP